MAIKAAAQRAEENAFAVSIRRAAPILEHVTIKSFLAAYRLAKLLMRQTLQTTLERDPRKCLKSSLPAKFLGAEEKTQKKTEIYLKVREG